MMTYYWTKDVKFINSFWNEIRLLEHKDVLTVHIGNKLLKCSSLLVRKYNR